ncbi:MAG: hypothetical protein AAF942_05420 [Pseudomonadota bacterium]
MISLGLGLAMAAASGTATLASKKHTQPVLWACAGHFEKRLDRVEASYGIGIYRERFLATDKGAVRRAIFVFPVAYRIMRNHLRSQTATRFGESRYVDLDSHDLSADLKLAPGGHEDTSARAPASDGQLASRGKGSGADNGVAGARLTTKPYNGVPSRKGWSELHMMVLDGASVLGRDSTLVVVSRHDSAEEWGTGTSGSLFNFGRHRTVMSYVTSTEFALMERLRKLYSTPFSVFALSATGPLAAETGALQAARHWLAMYADDPTQGLQAKTPGTCGKYR